MRNKKTVSNLINNELPWMRMAGLPCWLPRGQQVSYPRWVWGFHCTQVMKHASHRIHSGFVTQSRHHQKSKTGVSVAPQKGVMSSKKIFLTKTAEFKRISNDVSCFWSSFRKKINLLTLCELTTHTHSIFHPLFSRFIKCFIGDKMFMEAKPLMSRSSVSADNGRGVDV